MHFLNVFDGFAEEETAAVCALVVGEYINLLQVEQIFPLLLHGHIARYFTSFVSQEVDVAFLFHLFMDVVLRIHPFHHVVGLFGSKDVLIRDGEYLLRKFLNQCAICCRCFSYGKHIGGIYTVWGVKLSFFVKQSLSLQTVTELTNFDFKIMAFTSNIMIVRHRLLKELVKLWNNNELVDKIDRLPIELSPRRSKHAGRCCVHKERAVWKYKSLPLLGLDMEDETDELTPLSEYAARALDRAENGKPKDNIMCVIDEACSACVQINYEITNLCRGCTARSCQVNCPKKAVHVKESGQAWIDHDACISCGICHKSCPYHAIVYIPVPCEEACPVQAISKDEKGIEHIDESKCIYCGKCLNACPFGAIFEISQVFDVLHRIRKGEQVVAIVAPSILGQFKTTIEQVYGALKQVGFTDVIEVAQGAMDTVSNEAHELIEKLEEGQKFMTTSCCPSYIELVNKHIPAMKPYVSGTGSPMYYAARIAKEKYPDAKVVFIGPCVAKRKEVQRDEAVDFIMTFEEMASVLAGLDIQMEQAKPYSMSFTSVREAHGFAQAGGVMGAVKAYLKEEADKVNAVQVANLDKKAIGSLRAYAKTGKAPGQFIEVMACEGGCITGPCSHNEIAAGKRQLTQELAKREETY